MCNYKDYTEKDFDMSSSTNLYPEEETEVLITLNTWLHRAGKIFRSDLCIHRIVKAANSTKYRKISVNAALIKGRGIFSVPVIQTNRISDNKMLLLAVLL